MLKITFSTIGYYLFSHLLLPLKKNVPISETPVGNHHIKKDEEEFKHNSILCIIATLYSTSNLKGTFIKFPYIQTQSS